MLKQRGITMIEILVTIVIFGVGILGVAGLSLSGQRANQKAYESLLATWKAQELAEIMRANPANAASYLLAYDATPTSGADCSATNCSSTAIASYDLWLWANSLKENLPAASGAVYQSGGDFVVYVIWDSRDDKQSCTVSEATGSPALPRACVRMEFEL